MAEAPRSSNGEFAAIVHRNIRAMLEVRAKTERRATRHERVAGAITRFAGSMKFVYLHLAICATWLLINTGRVPGLKPFDPFPFVMLAVGASVEAIFLSTFILISQNKMQALADKRADLDLQINLLSEHEITRLIQLVDAIARHLKVAPEVLPKVEELVKDVQPERVLEEIERVDGEQDGGEHPHHHHHHHGPHHPR